MKNRQTGQSLLEYSILIIIIIGVFIAMESYVKRGVQGRWKTSTDSLGEQYDPRTAVVLVNYTLNSSSNTMIDIVPDANGYWTRRIDSAQSTEAKGGHTTVGAVFANRT